MIDNVKRRAALQPRREPYWYALGEGLHLGYRRTAQGGHWIARLYDAGTRRRDYKSLGELANVAPTDQFTVAAREARKWAGHVGSGGQSDALTVRQACERYVEHLRRNKGDAAADDAAGRFARHVYSDPIAKIPIQKLKPAHVGDWRSRLADKPASLQKRGPNCRSQAPQVERPRSESALNRDMAAIRAALNLAREDGYVLNDAAWRAKLKKIEDADGRRELELDRDQRRALIASSAPDIRDFIEGLCLLPLRPGTLAALTVGDYKTKRGLLTIKQDKSGQGRDIPVPPALAKLLARLTKDKLPNAPLFARADGAAWNKDSWKKPIATAVANAGLPHTATAYTL